MCETKRRVLSKEAGEALGRWSDWKRGTGLAAGCAEQGESQG